MQRNAQNLGIAQTVNQYDFSDHDIHSHQVKTIMRQMKKQTLQPKSATAPKVLLRCKKERKDHSPNRKMKMRDEPVVKHATIVMEEGLPHSRRQKAPDAVAVEPIDTGD